MKPKLTLSLALAMAAILWSLSASAAQPPNSNIEYLRPSDLNKSPSFMPGSAHGHVRQRLDYGQGYRYGHMVDSPLGHIIIWSATPNEIPDAAPIMKPITPIRSRTRTSIVPRLQYKPEYGKTSNPDYGQ